MARLQGRVLERGTRTPLAATVFAVDEKGEPLARAEANERGEFALALEGGSTIHVVVTAPDHKKLALDEKLGSREALTVTYVIARNSYSMYESTVRAQPGREEVARVSL